MLGASFLLGGLQHHVQDYNRGGGRLYSGLLLMATIALLAPAAVADLDMVRGSALLQKLSAGLAVLLIAAYGLGLLFSLKTHKELFARGSRRSRCGALAARAGGRHTHCRYGFCGAAERDIRQFGSKSRRDIGDEPGFRRVHHRRTRRRCGGDSRSFFCGAQEPS